MNTNINQACKITGHQYINDDRFINTSIKWITNKYSSFLLDYYKSKDDQSSWVASVDLKIVGTGVTLTESLANLIINIQKQESANVIY